jgi:broad specificity phosphatase PhoE
MSDWDGTPASLERFLLRESWQLLTERGYQQARALGRSCCFSAPFSSPSSTNVPAPPGQSRQSFWWRCYSSDLSRALETARTVLQEAQQLSQSSCAESEMPRIEDIRVDRRLRERAYGARELCRRDMSYAECIERWVSVGNQNRAATTSSGVRSGRSTLEEVAEEKVSPPLETEEDVWERAASFLRDLFADIAAAPVVGSGDGSSDELGAITERNIMIVSHAGCIRQILFHLVGEEGLRRHPNAAAAYEAETARFIIPNASLSVVRVCFATNNWIGHDREPTPIETNNADHLFAGSSFVSNVALEQLNWVDHLK